MRDGGKLGWYEFLKGERGGNKNWKVFKSVKNIYLQSKGVERENCLS